MTLITEAQKRLEEAALKFVKSVRGERRKAWEKLNYIASMYGAHAPYGEVSLESVRKSLIFELSPDCSPVGLSQKDTDLLDKWIMENIQLIGDAMFLEDDDVR